MRIIRLILYASMLVISNAAWPAFAVQAAVAEELPEVPKGPLLLTSVQPDQLNPEFWIQRLSDPDQVIMTASELKAFNEHIDFMIKDVVDVLKLDASRTDAVLREELEFVLKAVSTRRLYDTANEVVPKSFFTSRILPVMNTKAIPKTVTARWGAAIRAASIRSLPSDVKMLEKKDDIEFDQLQFSQIKLWTPVAVYHVSSDQKWYFVQAPYTRGWVHASDIALFDSRKALSRYCQSSSFLIVTGESIPIFEDRGLLSIFMRTSMGTRIPLLSQTSAGYEIPLLRRGTGGKAKITSGFVSIQADVTTQWLPYTQANIIRQAFKLLGARYGWGGSYNGRDCSGFIQDVFLSMGVNMPRTSKDQGYVGTKLGFFKPFQDPDARWNTIRQLRPGVGILRMPSHMMLYLGEMDGLFYAIHSTWAERYSLTSDAKNRINQVVVSDLSLNGKSRIGSLFDRVISINEVA